MPEQFDSKYFRGQGKLYIGDRNATTGAPEGLVFVGDVASVELTPNVERGEVIENVTGQGGIGASWLKRASYQLSITMRSIRSDHLALALQGAVTTKAAGSVTNEAATVRLGKASPLAHTNVSTVVVTGVGGAPTYVAGTDYVVHAAEGIIEWLTGGTVTDGLAVEIDYAYAAQDHVGSSPGNLDKYIVFAGINTADNDKQTRCEIYKCKLDPSVPSLVTDNESEMKIDGVIQTDTLRAAGDQFFAWKIEQ